MSEVELVKELRVNMHAYGVAQKAADTITRLLKERDEARSERDAALTDKFDATVERIHAAEAQVAALREALEFYAKKANWEPTSDDPEVPGSLQDPAAWQDEGLVARKALEDSR